MRILHILDHGLPLHSGYTFRTRAILKAQMARGWEVAAVTSPRHGKFDTDEETIAAVPGLPSAFTPAAQELLGARHIHEPLAIGVAVMAARALL